MTNLKNKKAFSLIELSIVLLIIGIIIAGVTQSSRLIRQFKITTARNLTTSGPVASIKDLGIWYESTLEESFISTEAQDSAIVSSAVSVWKDINTASSIKRNATQALLTNKPLYYDNCISGLPCLRFDGSTSYMDFDGTILVGTDYTLFAVVQRRNAVSNFFIGNNLISATPGTALEFGYTATSTISMGAGGDSTTYYTAGTVPAIAAYSTPSPALHVFVNSTIANGGIMQFNHYLNGSATASTLGGTGNHPTLTAYANATIGKNIKSTTTYYNGDIGEIIIYLRALKNEERAAVEDYLLKKWAIAGI